MMVSVRAGGLPAAPGGNQVSEPAIRNISDTARWVAVYRAMESERPDALFHDPYARRLAGERGEQIVRSLPRGQSAAWSMIVRTCIFDEILLRLVGREGVRNVLNLAAGLDARPYRLTLPPSLRWIEVDLPEILDYKEEVLAGEQPACPVESIRLDLTDRAARRQLFSRVGEGGGSTLVMTEGLLVYLPEPEVGALAADLAAASGFRWWLTDLVSPSILRYLRRWGKALDAAQASFQFAPEASGDYFRPFGWQAVEQRSLWLEAKRLDRSVPMAWLFDLLGLLRPRQRRDSLKTGTVLLAREPR
jgi:methyltransferase (TIGR00027 family)